MDETTVVIRLLHLSECECHPGWFVLGEWDGAELEGAWRGLALKALENPDGEYKLVETTTRTAVREMCLPGARSEHDRLQTSEG